MRKTVFILDDEADVRETMRTILASGGYKAVCFADETGLLKTIKAESPLAILLDVKLPGRSGTEILKDLAAYPVPVIMISGYGDIPTAVETIKSGAVDFIQKPLRRSDILDRLSSIEAIAARNQIGWKISSLNGPGREPLSRRERHVLHLAAAGLTNGEIAEKLHISRRTVEDHRSNIKHKMGVKTFRELLITLLR